MGSLSTQYMITKPHSLYRRMLSPVALLIIGLLYSPSCFPAGQSATRENGADPALLRTAQVTGGQAFPFSPDEMEKAGEILALLSTENDGDVLSVHDRMGGQPVTWTFPVDGSFKRLVLSVVGTRAVTVMRPDGIAVNTPSESAKSIELHKGAKVYAVERPAAGTWSVTASGQGPVSLRVLGKSTLFLSTFDFVKVGGRPGHEGLFPIQGAPIRGSTSQVRGRVSEGFENAHFELRSLGGKILAQAEMNADEDRETFLGTVEVPSQPFLVYVMGKDSRGDVIQRCKPSVELPTTVEISAPRSQSVAPGKSASLSITVRNRGAAGSFRIVACDTNATICKALPNPVELAHSESKEVRLTWQAPEKAIGTPNLLVTVERLNEPDDQSSVAVDLELEQP